MLCLERGLDESIILGDGVVTIMVVRFLTRGGEPRVRIAIEAPASVPINREEIYRELKAAGGSLFTKPPAAEPAP